MIDVLSLRKQVVSLRNRNRELESENERLKSIVEYIGILDYPEIFEEEEEARND